VKKELILSSRDLLKKILIGRKRVHDVLR